MANYLPVDVLSPAFSWTSTTVDVEGVVDDGHPSSAAPSPKDDDEDDDADVSKVGVATRRVVLLALLLVMILPALLLLSSRAGLLAIVVVPVDGEDDSVIDALLDCDPPVTSAVTKV